MLLRGIECPFTFAEMQERAEHNCKYYGSLGKLLNNHHLGDILNHLYALGIIGNCAKRQMRFSFRGDQILMIESPMKLHDSLWNYFAAKSRAQVDDIG